MRGELSAEEALELAWQSGIREGRARQRVAYELEAPDCPVCAAECWLRSVLARVMKR